MLPEDLSPNLSAIRETQRPGRCGICDEPLPPPKGGRPRRICLNPECRREYHRATCSDYRMRKHSKGGA